MTGYKQQETGTPRHLVLVDIENLVGTASPSPRDLDVAESRLREVICGFDQAQCVVACSHQAAKTAAFAFPGARRRWRSGPDGADRALIEELSDLRVMKRYRRVTLCSGDGIFAESVAALGAAGIEVAVVSVSDRLARALAMAAHHAVRLDGDGTAPAPDALAEAS